ncbi:uncharacterized protein METZ01_LOCUS454944, partial [marine metagenome]
VATLDERESISLPADAVDAFYDGLSALPGLDECLLLNTCNRTEIYGAGNGSTNLVAVSDYLADFRKLEPDFLERHSYRH